MECGTSRVDIQDTVSSSSLFTSFAAGTYGAYGATGSPGWAMIAGIGTGQGRSSNASCGSTLDSATGGIAYCSGPGAANSFGNHLASYYSSGLSDSPYVGCNGSGCNGPTCNLQVWVWLK
jgi:hypothetical protein